MQAQFQQHKVSLLGAKSYQHLKPDAVDKSNSQTNHGGLPQVSAKGNALLQQSQSKIQKLVSTSRH